MAVKWVRHSYQLEMNMTKTYIKVGDQVVDSEKVTKPSSRLFRDAWQLEGDVITVDMASKHRQFNG